MIAAVPGPGAHGGDGARLAEALGIGPDSVLDLSASLNPVAPDPAPVVARYLDRVRSYPDANPARDHLAAVMAVDPDCLVLTNGGAEAIALVAGAMPKGWVEEPEFSLYRRHLEYLDPNAPIWRSNPRNPTGLLAPVDQRAAVWDEAFWPLATGTWTRGDVWSHQSFVVGSLTKLLACPGLRIGYVLCPDPATARRIRGRQPEWSVNGLVASALPELLDPVDLQTWAAQVAALRAELVAVLEASGLRCRPSDANWVLVDAPGLRDRLGRHGIAVRDCANFGLPGSVRIAVPDAPGLARLEAAL